MKRYTSVTSKIQMWARPNSRNDSKFFILEPYHYKPIVRLRNFMNMRQSPNEDKGPFPKVLTENQLEGLVRPYVELIPYCHWMQLVKDSTERPAQFDENQVNEDSLENMELRKRFILQCHFK